MSPCTHLLPPANEVWPSCVVLFGGACMVLFGGVGGHAWFYSGGMHGFILGGHCVFFSVFSDTMRYSQ